MRVYNSSHTQNYAHHEIMIKPGFTDIPPEREESVRGLIKKYGAHLSEGGAPAAEGAKKDQTIINQATQIGELKAQVSKLQLLVTNSEDDESQKAALLARAEKAEAEIKIMEGQESDADQAVADMKRHITVVEANLVTANDEIVALKAQLAAKKK